VRLHAHAPVAHKRRTSMLRAVRCLLPQEPLVYYMLNKPRGCMSLALDGPFKKSAEGGTVLDYVPAYPRVFPVGRLDYDSEGLILLTNDGRQVHSRLMTRCRVDGRLCRVVSCFLTASFAVTQFCSRRPIARFSYHQNIPRPRREQTPRSALGSAHRGLAPQSCQRGRVQHAHKADWRGSSPCRGHCAE
jgi:hypothetical protein